MTAFILYLAGLITAYIAIQVRHRWVYIASWLGLRSRNMSSFSFRGNAALLMKDGKKVVEPIIELTLFHEVTRLPISYLMTKEDINNVTNYMVQMERDYDKCKEDVQRRFAPKPTDA